MITLILITSFAALTLWWIGIFLLWHIPYCKKWSFDENTLPSCSIIIPARNEAQNLPRLLDSIHSQSLRPSETIVVDDMSEDETPAIARAYGAVLKSITDKPAGWTGKTWACWQGALAAKGECLLFLDADTFLSREGLSLLLHSYKKYGGLITVQPYHMVLKPYESLSALFNIMIMAGMNAFTPFQRLLKPAGSFGPCVLCSRDDYYKIGGHEMVRETVLENVALGKRFQKHSRTVTCFGGKHTISFRMYPHSLKDLAQGWIKGFATGAAQTKPFFLLLTSLWITGCFFITGAAITIPFFFSPTIGYLVGGIYLLYTFQWYWMVSRIGSFGFGSALLFFIHCLFFVLLFCQSYFNIFIVKKVTWRGRTVAVPSKTKKSGS